MLHFSSTRRSKYITFCCCYNFLGFKYIVPSLFVTLNLQFVKCICRKKEIITWMHFAFSFNFFAFCFVHIRSLFLFGVVYDTVVLVLMLLLVACFVFHSLLQWALFVLHYFCIVWEFSLEQRIFFSFLIAVVIEFKQRTNRILFRFHQAYILNIRCMV